MKTFPHTTVGTVAATLCLVILGATLGHAAPKSRGHAKTTVGTLPPLTPTSIQPITPPSATPAPGDVLLYDGDSANTAGVTLSDWGGGSVEDSTDIAFAKTHAIKITTLDPYQGARITFTTPPALGDLTDKTRYLTLVIRLIRSPRNISQDTDNGTDAQGQDQGAPPPPAPQGNGQPGQTAAAPADNTSLPAAQNLHMIFTMAGGAQADLMRPLPQFSSAQDGIDQWITMSVPLADLAVPGATGDASLQSLQIAGDDYTVMYVGQIKIVQDSTPITCFAGDDQNAATSQTVTLKGTAAGGASALVYSWDFDAKDGITDQAQGPTVTTQYLKPGDYTATLTVSDLDGLKKPASATTVIHVTKQ